MLVWDGKNESKFTAEKVTRPRTEVESQYGLVIEPVYQWPFGSPYHPLSFYPEPPDLTIGKSDSADPFSRSLNAVEDGE